MSQRKKLHHTFKIYYNKKKKQQTIPALDWKARGSNTRKHTFGSRSFSIYGANLWNSLLDRIRAEINFEKFKTKLKTHLFTIAYM